MNLEPNSTPTYNSVPQPFEIASTRLRALRRQKPNVLEFCVLSADDRSLPVPAGARLGERPALPAEIAKKTYQLERCRQIGTLVDVTSDIYCIACKRLTAECSCPKPAAADGLANAAAEERGPFDHSRRRKHRRVHRGIEGGVP